MIFCKERSEIMKLMTMNVHSLVEKDYERKLVEFADVAAREKPDILALQVAG